MWAWECVCIMDGWPYAYIHMDTYICKYKIYIVCKYTHTHTHTHKRYTYRETERKTEGERQGMGQTPWSTARRRSSSRRWFSYCSSFRASSKISTFCWRAQLRASSSTINWRHKCTHTQTQTQHTHTHTHTQVISETETGSYCKNNYWVPIVQQQVTAWMLEKLSNKARTIIHTHVGTRASGAFSADYHAHSTDLCADEFVSCLRSLSKCSRCVHGLAFLYSRDYLLFKRLPVITAGFENLLVGFEQLLISWVQVHRLEVFQALNIDSVGQIGHGPGLSELLPW